MVEKPRVSRFAGLVIAALLGAALMGQGAASADVDGGTKAPRKPNKGRCVSELNEAGFIGRGSNPGQANIIVGTEGDDLFDPALYTDGADLVCGFGGNDEWFTAPLGEGDVFLGGDGDDAAVSEMRGGTFIGGNGNDRANDLIKGTFIGGAGDDFVLNLTEGRDGLEGPAIFEGGDGNDTVNLHTGGTFNGGEGSDLDRGLQGGTFNGGAGDDEVGVENGATAVFNGGPGNDRVSNALNNGTFNGEEGDDQVRIQRGGVFNGGAGNDTVLSSRGGTFNQDG